MPYADSEQYIFGQFAAVLSGRNGADKDSRPSMIEFRAPMESDKETIEHWISNDPDHQGMKPDFFFNKGSMSLVLEDVFGPGLFVRIDPEPPSSVRLHIQFSPSEVRSGKTLLRGWPEFSKRIWGSGISRMVFESRTSHLIGFCRRCFGFQRVGTTDDYELKISLRA